MKKIIIKDLKLLLKLLLVMTCTSAILSVVYVIIQSIGDAVIAIEYSVNGGYASWSVLVSTFEQLLLMMIAAAIPFLSLVLIAAITIFVFRDRG